LPTYRAAPVAGGVIAAAVGRQRVQAEVGQILLIALGDGVHVAPRAAAPRSVRLGPRGASSADPLRDSVHAGCADCDGCFASAQARDAARTRQAQRGSAILREKGIPNWRDDRAV